MDEWGVRGPRHRPRLGLDPLTRAQAWEPIWGGQGGCGWWAHHMASPAPVSKVTMFPTRDSSAALGSGQL